MAQPFLVVAAVKLSMKWPVAQAQICPMRFSTRNAAEGDDDVTEIASCLHRVFALIGA
jgi:hypothetical protein